MFDAEANVRVCRQMVDLDRAGDRCCYSVEIQKVHFNQPEIWLTKRVIEKAALASRKIINANDDISVVNKSVDQVAAYESGAPGNHHRPTHVPSNSDNRSCPKRTRSG